MFGRHFFGGAYYGPRYFGDGGTVVVVPHVPDPPPVVVQGGSGGGGMFGRHERPPPFMYRRRGERKRDEERIEKLLEEVESVVSLPSATLAPRELRASDVISLRDDWRERVAQLQENVDLLEEAIIILAEARNGA